jgi:hypothetical protein
MSANLVYTIGKCLKHPQQRYQSTFGRYADRNVCATNLILTAKLLLWARAHDRAALASAQAGACAYGETNVGTYLQVRPRGFDKRADLKVGPYVS